MMSRKIAGGTDNVASDDDDDDDDDDVLYCTMKMKGKGERSSRWVGQMVALVEVGPGRKIG